MHTKSWYKQWAPACQKKLSSFKGMARVHADVETSWHCRLHGPVVYAKRGDTQPLLLWGVCGEAEQAETSGGAADEWMYKLARQQANPWELHNDAMKTWVRGRGEDARQKASAAVVGRLLDNAVTRRESFASHLMAFPGPETVERATVRPRDVRL